jgi:hypothetical protein
MLRSMVWIASLVLAGACASPQQERAPAPVEPPRATQEADPRTNSLIVVAQSATDSERMLELIARLDEDSARRH